MCCHGCTTNITTRSDGAVVLWIRINKGLLEDLPLWMVLLEL